MSDEPARRSILKSLSARLLLLTVAFVMLGEFLIYAPSVARFRSVYLEERIAEARLASLALETAPATRITAGFQQKILDFSNTYNIVLRLPGRSILALGDRTPPPVDVTYDLRSLGLLKSIADAIEALAQRQNRILRVIGEAPNDPETIVEVMLDETPMRTAMYAFSRRILGLSVVISLITAGLVYLSLQWLMVRPMRRITESMMAFRARPEAEAATLPTTRREDEIGVAQRELAVMQAELRAALQQKERLAALGSAVAKVNHDLRNSLSTAVLISDSLADSDDPDVKRVLPKLFDAMDRAVALCSHTLNFVRDSGPKVQATEFVLRDLVGEVGAGIKASDLGSNGMVWDNQIDAEIRIEADREQLHRAFTNVGRNAYQAGATTVRLAGELRDDKICVEIADDGPGLLQQARDHLFEPFSSSTKPGGTGLGLVIVRDVLRAHGGDVSLVDSGANGTTFRIMLPERCGGAVAIASRTPEEAGR